MTTAGSEEDRDCGRRRDEDKLAPTPVISSHKTGMEILNVFLI